jgi:hypothetical protein
MSYTKHPHFLWICVSLYHLSVILWCASRTTVKLECAVGKKIGLWNTDLLLKPINDCTSLGEEKFGQTTKEIAYIVGW